MNVSKPSPVRLQSIAIALAAAMPLMPGAGFSASAPRPNVILITVDTLRADRLGCYGNRTVPTSAMDRVAKDGILFRRAISQVPLTLPSHAAILTGTYPMWNGVEDILTSGLGPGIPTLAELFKSHGYSTAAFVSSFVLNSMWGLNRGFDFYDDWFDVPSGNIARRRPLERRAGETIDHSIKWLMGQKSGPFFVWIHLYDPHAPYEPPEPFKSRYASRPYDGEVAYTDQEIGRLLSYFEKRRLYGSSLILLAGDHGEGLGEHHEPQHGLFIYNSTVHVPLIIKLPSGWPRPRESVAQVVNTVDIAPTIAQVCGFAGSETAGFQGRSLLPLAVTAREGSPRDGYSESLYPRTSFGWHSLHGIETERYHYIEAPREELYDLDRDPDELHNLFQEKPSLAAMLRGSLRGIERRYQSKPDSLSVGAPPDLEKLRELRSLGYIGGSDAQPSRDDPPAAPDPKDRVSFYNSISRATELAEDGRILESNELLSRAAAEDPRAYLPLFLMGENLLSLGRFRESMTKYSAALALNPRFDQAAMGLGQAALRNGDAAGAAKAYQWALELNPRNFVARLALAKAYEQLNRLPEALKQQNRVLQEHPQAAEAYSDYGITLVRLKRYDEALASLTKALQLGYHSAMTCNFLGTARLATKHTQEAINAYEEAIRLDGEYSAPYGNLALLYAQVGEREKSLQFYRKVCQVDAELCSQLASRFK